MINITIDTKGLQQATDRLHLLTERQLQFAMVQALNATTQATAAALRTDLQRTSGGPIAGGATRWTIGAVYQRKASTSTLASEAGIRQDTPRAAGRYLLPMIKGTMPRTKAVDLKAGALAKDRGVVIMPTRHVRTTAQGNVTRQRFVSTLGQVGRVGSRYFIAPIQRGSQTKALFERVDQRNRRIKPLFVLQDPTRRRSTFNIGRDLRQTVDQVFPGEIRSALAKQLQMAGFS